MPPRTRRESWSAERLAPVADELTAIHDDMLRLEDELQGRLAEVHDAFRDSARNLVHYLALRRHDLRALQEKLAFLGLSSLGRTESHVLAAVEAVLAVLERLLARELRRPDAQGIGFSEGKALLRAHTDDLLGSPPPGRSVRIMVTMPSEAAHDPLLVRGLLARGMDVMRVNCAHDGPPAWKGMVENLRRAERELGRRCHVEMDLAGPKLRTGPIDPRSQIVKWRPKRDASGRVTGAARVWLTSAAHPQPAPTPADGWLWLEPELLARLREGERLRLRDLRGKSRTLDVGDGVGAGRWAASQQTAYLAARSVLDLAHRPRSGPEEKLPESAAVGTPAPSDCFVQVAPGDTLRLTRAQTPGLPALRDDAGHILRPASLPCTLPEVFADVRPNERIAFDDGRIGGVIEEVSDEVLRIRITSAKPGGDKLRADKGINLPDSDLRLPALGAKDLDDLSFAVEHADIIGFSFVKRPEDVHLLQDHLARLGRTPAVLLKIETRSGFERLPSLLLAAMRSPRVGVMIARGDLAVEVGWERLAEAQEEILWICEAAHVPVVWATQVLESLAKKGVPSRAEITDAAMGERAECVMLNKGPHLVEAVRVLDDILERMEAHQSKKSARLRLLRLSTLDSRCG